MPAAPTALLVLTISSAHALDWLLNPPTAFPPATASFVDSVLTLTNGLVTRKFVVRDGLFACTSYQREGADGEQPTDVLRVVKPEAIIELDGVAYAVGGAAATVNETCDVAACPDAARRGIFTDDVALAALEPNKTAWQYVSHAIVPIDPPFEWTPGTRHAPADVAWPPLGVAVDVVFRAPAWSSSVLERHRRVGVVVRYELYQGVPLLTKRVTLRDAAPRAPFVEVTGLTVELLGLTQPASPLPLVSYAPQARGEWGEAGDYGVQNGAPWGGGKGYPGLLHAEADTPHVASVVWADDTPSLGTGTLLPGGAPGAGEPVLRASYAQRLLGSAADPLPPSRSWHDYAFRVPLDPSMPGTEGGALASFRLLQLLHEVDAAPERKSMGLRRMRRLLAPAVQENPIFMHLTADPHNLTAVDATLAQMSQVGFEMAIFSFGSGFDLESSDPVFLATVKNFTATARAAGIEVGAYDLIAETRNPPEYEWSSLDADSGEPNGNACFASKWVDFLSDAVARFVNETGFAAIETDGPFGGQPCASTAHAYHRDVNDSVFRQNYLQEKFYQSLRTRNLYIHQPDDYFYHGASKSGMGYNENQYSLPRWEDLHVSRAGMFDDTRGTPVTQVMIPPCTPPLPRLPRPACRECFPVHAHARACLAGLDVRSARPVPRRRRRGVVRPHRCAHGRVRVGSGAVLWVWRAAVLARPPPLRLASDAADRRTVGLLLQDVPGHPHLGHRPPAPRRRPLD